jgi:hypothetical protein
MEPHYEILCSLDSLFIYCMSMRQYYGVLLLLSLAVLVVIVIIAVTKQPKGEKFEFKKEKKDWWQQDYMANPPDSYYWTLPQEPGMFSKLYNNRGYASNGLWATLRPGIHRDYYPRSNWYSSDGGYYLMNNDGSADVNGASVEDGGEVVDYY